MGSSSYIDTAQKSLGLTGASPQPSHNSYLSCSLHWKLCQTSDVRSLEDTQERNTIIKFLKTRRNLHTKLTLPLSSNTMLSIWINSTCRSVARTECRFVKFCLRRITIGTQLCAGVQCFYCAYIHTHITEATSNKEAIHRPSCAHHHTSTMLFPPPQILKSQINNFDCLPSQNIVWEDIAKAKNLVPRLLYSDDWPCVCDISHYLLNFASFTSIIYSVTIT